MAPEEIEVSDVIPASPERVYAAWLSSAEHSAMTGGKADVNAAVGQSFSAWDGYIEGVNVELEPGRRILQNWRTSEFPPESPDSKLEVSLDPDPEGTRVTVRHWNIPEGQGQSYRSGWSEHYFEPMKDYFTAGTSRTEEAVAALTAGAENLKEAARAAAAAIGTGAENLKEAVRKAAASVRKKATRAKARKPAKKAAAAKRGAKKKAAPKKGAKKLAAAKSTRKKSSARKAPAKKAPAKKKSPAKRAPAKKKTGAKKK